MLKRNEEWKSQAACRNQAALFQNTLLDFDPEAEQTNLCLSCSTPLSRDGENVTHATPKAALACPAAMLNEDGSLLLDTPVVPDYAMLTAEERKDLLAQKKQVEDAAIDVCMGCPVMFKCEEWALSEPVYGVAGGRTEAERRAIRDGKGLADPKIEEVTTSFSIDRGPRNQVDDAAIARMTAQGMDSRAIAQELQCSERSVVRARARVRKAQHADAPTQDATTETAPACVTPPQTSTDTGISTIESTNTPIEGLLLMTEEVQQEVQGQSAPTAAKATPKATPKVSKRKNKSAPRMGRVSKAMTEVYMALSNGEWMHRNDLVAIAVEHISDEDALAFWTTGNSTVVNGVRVLKTGREQISREVRITTGAAAKAANMITASARVGGYTERDKATDQYRLTSAALAEIAGLTKAQMVAAA